MFIDQEIYISQAMLVYPVYNAKRKTERQMNGKQACTQKKRKKKLIIHKKALARWGSNSQYPQGEA